MSTSLNALIPEFRPFARALVDAAGAAGLMPRVTSTLRSRAEQERLYRHYQQGLQTLPVAPPGTSAHEYGFALDMVVSPMEALTDVGRWWESNGGVWGGEFHDPVHFEYPGFALESAATPFEPSLYDKVLNFAISFVPLVGETQLAVTVLGFFLPGLSQSTLADMIENPLLHLERWAAVQQQWIG